MQEKTRKEAEEKLQYRTNAAMKVINKEAQFLKSQNFK